MANRGFFLREVLPLRVKSAGTFSEKRQRFFRFRAVLFCLLLACLPLRGQADGDNRSGAAARVRDFLELLEEESAQEEGFSPALWEENREEWEYLLANPLDLNRATRRDLERIPFLPPEGAQQILDYRARHGAFRSLQELQLLPAFSRRGLRLVGPFLCVRPPGASADGQEGLSLRRGRHDLQLKASLPLYRREGYREKTVPELMENPDAAYLGPPVAHSLRYSFRLADRLQAGLTASNDAGEPFFRGTNRKGYDAYSLYFLYRGRGWFHTLALGSYRIDLGQGLTMGNGFLSSKGSALPVAGLNRGKLRAHTSLDEYNYLSGAAFVLQPLPRLRLSAFYSYRRPDGRTESGDTLVSITTDGYHRLPREAGRRHAAVLQTAGGSVHYLGTRLEAGLNAVGYFFSKTYQPALRYYNTYYFRGRRGYNLSADYRLLLGRTQLSGEIALDPAGHTALLQTVRQPLPGDWTAVLLYRRYDLRYRSFYARSFSEGGYVQNEEGLYLGAEGPLPLRGLRLTLFADFFRFPYPKYNVSAPSRGFDLMGRLLWTPRRGWQVDAYYRYKQKGKNLTSAALDGEDRHSVVPYATHRAKLQLRYAAGGEEEFVAKTSLLFTSAGHLRHRRGLGWMAAQAVVWKPRRLPLQAAAGVGGFRTDDYASRLYSYEYGLPYTFSVPSFYGRGLRAYVMLRYNWGRRLALIGKYGLTRYFDRSTISSGLQRIDSPAKQDLDFMLRLTL